MPFLGGVALRSTDHGQSVLVIAHPLVPVLLPILSLYTIVANARMSMRGYPQKKPRVGHSLGGSRLQGWGDSYTIGVFKYGIAEGA